MRARIAFAQEASQQEIEQQVLADERIQKWLQGKAPRKVIVVPQRIVNVVVS